MPELLQKFKSLIFLLVLTILMFVPLYMKFPLTAISGTFVAIRLEDVLILFTFFVWIIYLAISKEFFKILESPLNQAILTFFFIGALSVFSGVFVSHTITLNLGILHWLRRVEMLLLLPLGLWVAKNYSNPRKYFTVLTLVIFIVNSYALGQKYLHFPAITTLNEELSKGAIYYLGSTDRVNSTFAGHYDLAVFLMMAVVAISGIIFSFLDSKNRFKKPFLIAIIWLIFIFALSSLVLIMTAARLSFVGAVLGVFISLILLKKKKFLVLAVLGSLIILIYPSQLRDRFISTVKINVARDWKSYFAVSKEQEMRSKLNIPTLPSSGKKTEAIGADSPDITPGEPVDTTDLGVYRSFDIRVSVEWPRALRAFIQNPLLGTGYSSLGLATDNDLLRALGEVGLFGTVAFIYILIILIKKYIGAIKRENNFNKYLAVGVLSMTLAFILNSLFIDVFEASKVAYLFWLVNGLSYGLISKI